MEKKKKNQTTEFSLKKSSIKLSVPEILNSKGQKWRYFFVDFFFLDMNSILLISVTKQFQLSLDMWKQPVLFS